MTLDEHLKQHAPGWTVGGLAGHLEYTKDGLRRVWRKHPTRVKLWIAGLKQESNNVQDDR